MTLEELRSTCAQIASRYMVFAIAYEDVGVEVACESIAEAIQAIQLPEFSESPWLPVETAPKDFCTVFDGWNGERVANVFWGHPEYTEKGVYDWVTSEYIQGFGNENQRVRNLTHWMPLPPTPEEIK